MKRLAAIGMVVMLMVSGCVCAYGEDDRSVSDIYMEQLKVYQLYYDLLPSDFGRGYIVCTYHLFALYMHSKALEMAQNLLKFDSMQDMIVNIDRSTYIMTQEEPVKFYGKWLDGEITDAECAEELMKLVNAVIAGAEKAAEAVK